MKERTPEEKYRRHKIRQSIGRILDLAKELEYRAYQRELIDEHEHADRLREEARSWRKMAYIIKQKYLEIRGWEEEWLK